MWSEACRRSPKALEAAELQLTTRTDYRAHIDAGMTAGDPDDAGLVPLLDTHGSSFYLRWSGAVVMLGSEGQAYVAARSEAEFVSLLPYGDLINDAMKYWFARLRPPHETYAGLVPTPEILQTYRTVSRQRDAWKTHLIAVATAAGVAIEPDPFEVVGEANRELLAPFTELVQRRFRP